MYDEMTNSDFICVLMEKAHPADNPSAEHANLMDEAARRIRKLEAQVRAWESAADNGSGSFAKDGSFPWENETSPSVGATEK